MNYQLEMNAKLPYWYLNQQTSIEESIDPATRDKLINERLDFLKNPDRKDIEFGLDKYDKEELGKRERMAFTIMKIGACLDPRLSAWLIETEGDVFEKDFRLLKWNDKKAILDDLYPREAGAATWSTVEDLVYDMNEGDLYKKLSIKEESTQQIRSSNTLYATATVKDVRGMNKYIALDFRFASQLIRTRKAILYRGWAITTVSRFIVTIKHRYEETIGKSLTEYADRLENKPNPVMKKIAKEVNEILQKKVEFRRSRLQIDAIELEGTLDENMGILPPCIEDLLVRVNEVGYIGHWERLQLGIFLKKIGMDVETQLHFWYDKAVDNVNMTFDDFINKAGYVIRHIYGLEGGKVNYEMPSCTTIQGKMFCTFRHLGIEHINKRVVSILKRITGDKQDENKKNVAKRIIEASIRGLPNMACAYNLDLITGIKRDKIVHPMIYLKLAGEKSGKIKKELDKNKTGELVEEGEK